MQVEDISKLVEKYKEGTLSAEEKDFLDSWYIQHTQGKLSSADPNHLQENLDEIWTALTAELSDKGFQSNKLQPKRKSIWPRIAAAASLLLVAGTALFFFNKNDKDLKTKNIIATADIKPGSNKAWLTLADGTKISLSDAKNGELANQSGIEVTKTADGQLIYEVSAKHQKSNVALDYNTIETPKGGQFQINLPDGTKVWLNAASTIKYAVNFTADAKRLVELNGEAYFEVAKDKKHPFIVKSARQEIEVLGTHFNVNSYAEDHKVKTTLLEGSVRVKSLLKINNSENEMLLKPGEQSLLSNSSFVVNNVDPEEAVAWKNGLFMFNHASLTDVMSEISRWYNVDIEYKGTFDKISLGGSVSKFLSITEVLEVLEQTGKIRFKIEGRKVTVNRLAD